MKNFIDDPGYDPVNPYRFDFDIPILRYVQCFICFFTILPIRLVLLFVHLTVIYICCYITTLGLPRISQTNDMVGWRGFMQWFITKVLWTTMTWSCGVIFTSKGVQATKEEAPIVLCTPHSSIFDNLLCSVTQRPFFTVARDEKGVIGTLLRVICAIFTDRQNPESTEFAYNEIQRRVNDPKWPQMLLWPEGTTHNRLACPRHKLGSYKPGLPVQPLVLRFPNRWETDVWTFKGPGVPSLWFYSLMQLWINIEIEYLEPYRPSEEEKKNPRLFANNVRHYISEHLKVPEVDLGREDGWCLLAAEKAGLPGHAGLVNINYFVQNFGYGRDYIYASADSALHQFAKLSQQKELADYDDLCLYLLLPRSELLKSLLAIYDRNQSWCFSFRDFLYIRATRAAPALERLNISNLFKCLDKDGDGKLSYEDISNSLNKYFGGNELTYRQLWNRETVGEESSSDEDESYLSEKQLADILNKYPEYALLYELATINPADGN